MAAQGSSGVGVTQSPLSVERAGGYFEGSIHGEARMPAIVLALDACAPYACVQGTALLDAGHTICGAVRKKASLLTDTSCPSQ